RPAPIARQPGLGRRCEARGHPDTPFRPSVLLVHRRRPSPPVPPRRLRPTRRRALPRYAAWRPRPLLSPPLGLDREAGPPCERKLLAFGIGKYLAGIEQSGRVERGLHARHHLQVVGAEDPRHVGAFLESDAMLARERAAQLD